MPQDSGHAKVRFADLNLALAKHRQAIHEVWREVGMLMILGALIGVACVLAAELFIPHEGGPGWLSALLTEIGTGFIVAVIAVFGYEFVTHITHAVKNERKLAEQIETLATVQETLRRASDWKTAMRADLVGLLRNEEFASATLAPVIHATNISARQKDACESMAYLRVLSELLDESVAPVARALDEFHEGVLARKNLAGCEYTAPDTRIVAGKVLALMLARLGEGDCYKSVSNLLFYKDTLMGMLVDAAQEACGRGVTIHRLFNMSNFELEQPSRAQLDTARRVYQWHAELARAIKAAHGEDRYQIRFWGQALLEFRRTQFRPNDSPHLAALPESCFGLFCDKSENSATLFYAMEPRSASKVWLAYLDGKDPTERYFDEMWALAARAPNPLLQTEFDKTWLDRTAAELRQG